MKIVGYRNQVMARGLVEVSFHLEHKDATHAMFRDGKVTLHDDLNVLCGATDVCWWSIHDSSPASPA